MISGIAEFVVGVIVGFWLAYKLGTDEIRRNITLYKKRFGVNK